MTALCLWICLLLLVSPGDFRVINWCVTSDNEYNKCQNLASAVVLKKYDPSGIDSVGCVHARDKNDCVDQIDKGSADIVDVDTGFALTVGLTYVLEPLVAESYYQRGAATAGSVGQSVYSVAVVKKTSSITSIAQLRKRTVCSPGAQDFAGWMLPLIKIAEQSATTGFQVTDCNINIKAAASVFSQMCVPGALDSVNNPLGDNPIVACSLCKGTGSSWCTARDPYAGYDGALQCVADGAGDVAFIRDIDVEYLTRMTTRFSRNDYELLCPDGVGRRPLGQYASCNWGVAPANLIVTSGSRQQSDLDAYVAFLTQLPVDFPTVDIQSATTPAVVTIAPRAANGSTITTTTTTAAPVSTRAPGSSFSLANSAPYGDYSLLVNDMVGSLVATNKPVYDWAGGTAFQARLSTLTKCNVNRVRFCVISEPEMTKCEQMLLALEAKNLKPSLDCILGTDTNDCMIKIANDDADIVALDAGDIYEAGSKYDLVPIANENYGDTGSFYYAVAVARKPDPQLTLFNLKARNSCHGGMRLATGWIYPLLSLMETVQIRPQLCGAVKAVGELFQHSCVPGILDSTYNAYGTNPVNLCENCAGGNKDKCQRNTAELYYGDSGAFRCLVEHGGDIAYVRHTTARDNTDGRNRDFWARNRRSDDYELLCKNGRRAAVTQWSSCYLAQVPGKAIVAASFKSAQQRIVFWNLLNYAQLFYSSDSDPYFTMFDSGEGQDDLLFSDSTMQLVPVDVNNQTYSNYLGTLFLKAMRTVNRYDCSTQSTATRAVHSATSLASVLAAAIVAGLMACV